VVVAVAVVLPQEEALPQEAPMVAGTQAVAAAVAEPGGRSAAAEILAVEVMKPRVVREGEVGLPEVMGAAAVVERQVAEERQAPWPPLWAAARAAAQGESRTQRGRRT